MHLPVLYLLEGNIILCLESGRKKILLLCISIPSLLQGECPFISVVAVVFSQSFSLHYQAFSQCEVAISHSDVMWTDNWDISGNCWWSWLMFRRAAVSRAELGAQISDRDGVEHPCWCTHHWCQGVWGRLPTNNPLKLQCHPNKASYLFRQRWLGFVAMQHGKRGWNYVCLAQISLAEN